MLSLYRYYLPPDGSPTTTNLAYHLREAGWKPTQYAWRAQFTKQHLDFDSIPAQAMEYKHLLARLLADQEPAVTPITYTLNEDNWPQVCDTLGPNIWILKPSMLNNGQHIHIFETTEKLKAHYRQSNRMGGEHVIQHYITQPHLLKGPKQGHKYSLRLFMVLSTHNGAFLYPQGYFNIALKPYLAGDYSDLCPHLTNEHLTQNQSNVIQIPTQQYALFKPLYPKIKAILSILATKLQETHPYLCGSDKPHRLAIFGCDFLVDADERVWLLEANHAPCFPIEHHHPLQKPLYEAFWQEFIRFFVQPNNQALSLFEPLA